MKPMYYLSIFLMAMTLLGSCEAEESPTDSPDSVDAQYKKETYEKVYELDLHQYAIQVKLVELKKREKYLIAQIEDGNDKLKPELKAVRQDIKLQNAYYAFNEKAYALGPIPGPGGKRPPRVPPIPNPCESGNCSIGLGRTFEFWAFEPEDLNATVLNADGEPMGEITNTYESKEFKGILISEFENKEGMGILRITKYSELTKEMITFDVPIGIQ